MKSTTLATAIILSISSAASVAQTYQAEVGLDYTRIDIDDLGSDGAFLAQGRYHFSAVQTANLPLAEAAFMQRSSNVYAYVLDDADAAGGGVEFYIPAAMLYLNAEVLHSDYDFQDSETDWQARIGITPMDGLLVTTTLNEDDYEFNLQTKYVTALGGGNFLNVEAAYADGGDAGEDFVGVFADFYFDSTFSIGAGYEDQWDDQYTLRTRKFFTESFSGELSYTKFDEGNAVTVGAALRF